MQIDNRTWIVLFLSIIRLGTLTKVNANKVTMHVCWKAKWGNVGMREDTFLHYRIPTEEFINAERYVWVFEKRRICEVRGRLESPSSLPLECYRDCSCSRSDLCARSFMHLKHLFHVVSALKGS